MKSSYYIGIMSGTSLDGVDVVLTDLSTSNPKLIQTLFRAYDDELRQQLLSLQQPGFDELHRTAMLGKQLSCLYAETVINLLANTDIKAEQIIAIGCHGQTVRHCPEVDKGYTIQLVNAALLAELTQITVVADFRSRDMAAGGQGAPLVPAFHHALFKSAVCHRVIVNIGGIANVTSLDPYSNTAGFDCGPGNILMDAWCLRHIGENYDKYGQWAASGKIILPLLENLLNDRFFLRQPPKSTGRELFNLQWLEQKLLGHEWPQDVQATLLQLTVLAIVNAISEYCSSATEIYLCGGGAHNTLLIDKLAKTMPGKKVALTDELGVPADWVEAFAFAWLAQQAILRKTGNLVTVTGARGDRILGAIYPA